MDICINHDCQLRDKCYRYLAPKSKYQWVCKFTPNEDGTCNHFIKINKVETFTTPLIKDYKIRTIGDEN